MNEEMAWIMQAQQGNDEAFAWLVDHYQAPVFNMCYRMLSDPEGAEDAAQESFLRAYQNLSRFDRQRPFATWLLSIAAHYCIDQLRKKRFSIFSMDVEPSDDEAPFELPDPGSPNPENEVVRHEEQGQIQTVLRSLDATDRATVILRYWYDFSEIEIAESLKLTVSAVKSRLHRSRKTIARVISEEAQESRLERIPYESPAL